MFDSFPKTRQLDIMDCGPGCLQIISKYYGKIFPIYELREMCNVTKEGTSVYDLCIGAENIGFKTLSVKTSYKWLDEKVPLPCIVHWKNNHFIVVYKIKNRTVYVSDPVIGLVKYSKEEFVRGWLGHLNIKGAWRNGVCIVLETTPKFNDIKPIKEKPTNIHLLRYLIANLSKYKVQSFQMVGLMFLIAALQAIFPIITQSIVDIGISSKDISFINLLIIAYVVLVLSTSLSTWIQQSLNMHISTRIKLSLLSDYITKLLHLPVTFFERKLTGDILQRAKDYERFESFIMKSAFRIILALFNIIVFGIILLFYHSTLFWIFIIGSFLYVFWVLLFWNIKKKMDIDQFSLLSRNQSQWIEILNNIQDIKNNNYEYGKRWKWEKIQVKLYKVGLKLLNIKQLETLGTNLINTIRDVILTYISALAVIRGDLSLGMLIAIQHIIGQLKAPVAQVIMFVSSYQMAYISFLRMNEINLLADEQSDKQLKGSIIPDKKEIVLKNVFYKYHTNATYVLRNISLKIPENKTTAIIGLSGSGKSTLLKILLGIYKPSTGGMFINEQNMNSISLKIWRDRIGVVTQDSQIFNDTILNNIVLGEYNLNKQKLFEAVFFANIKKEIESLPSAYNTFMGENGRGMSEGQKQRILLARAIYKNPDFLFLDEATSALDAFTEKKILDNFKKIKEKTLVIISHRLSNILNADKAILLDKGQIIEQGNPKELIDKKGFFYTLFKAQLALSNY